MKRNISPRTLGAVVLSLGITTSGAWWLLRPSEPEHAKDGRTVTVTESANEGAAAVLGMARFLESSDSSTLKWFGMAPEAPPASSSFLGAWPGAASQEDALGDTSNLRTGDSLREALTSDEPIPQPEAALEDIQALLSAAAPARSPWERLRLLELTQRLEAVHGEETAQRAKAVYQTEAERGTVVSDPEDSSEFTPVHALIRLVQTEPDPARREHLIAHALQVQTDPHIQQAIRGLATALGQAVEPPSSDVSPMVSEGDRMIPSQDPAQAHQEPP